ATVLAKYQAKGCEVIRFAAADVAAARRKAMEAWRAATKGDAVATRVLDSQVAFMKELGLLGCAAPRCPRPPRGRRGPLLSVRGVRHPRLAVRHHPRHHRPQPQAVPDHCLGHG